ncbi:MAG: glycosyltransferase family 2 protein [Anaerolineae bacterium]|nr:glycosyltransferase family 2 protein [Anaerolineae bacterium]
MGSNNATVDLSVVLPVYNEAESLPAVIPEISGVLKEIGRAYEIVAVDDGSSDGSVDVLRSLQTREPNLRIIEFRRNFGQTAAFSAGFDYARGDIIITLDADGQNDPADIPRLLAVMEERDCDLVNGWRQDRKEPFLTRRLPSILANMLIARSSNVRLHDRGCSLKVLRRDLVKQMHLYGELHRFVPDVASLVGARIAEVPVNDRARVAGQSNYGALSRTPRVLLDLVLVFFFFVLGAFPLFRLFHVAQLPLHGLEELVLHRRELVIVAQGGLVGVDHLVDLDELPLQKAVRLVDARERIAREADAAFLVAVKMFAISTVDHGVEFPGPPRRGPSCMIPQLGPAALNFPPLGRGCV